MALRILLGWLVGCFGFQPATAWAEEQAQSAQSRPRIALIIDDLGNKKRAGEAALELPGPVTYAFLPHTPFAREQAVQAHRRQKEVMLHLPMESHHGNRLGKGGLKLGMRKRQFLQTVQEAVASVPHVAGINNHMGSLLTRDPTSMRWLMTSLRETNLYFIDSRTTERTVAEKVARKNLIQSARRDIFLDNEEDEALIRRQFYKLIDIARERGEAIGIGHPYPATLAVLASELPLLEELGVELVPASQLTKEGSRLWHASSSPLPKAVKNSKLSPSPIY
jgi:polysaccharide deacetylase 2 family uncharacterized protein YibQ